MSRRYDAVVYPNVGDALENPICPSHHRRMRVCVARSFEAAEGSGLTFLWWRCPRGCRTAMVPIPYGLVERLGPTMPGSVLRIGPVT